MGDRFTTDQTARRRLVAAAAIAVLSFASCGGDDDGGDDAGSTVAAATDAAVTTTDGNATATESSPSVAVATDGSATATQSDAAGASVATTSAASSAASAAPGGTPGEATGEPIKVMTVAPINSQSPPYPNIHEAARIYGEWLNDRGGINGRPLEVILCDGRGDPNEDANCGRQAAEQGVVALVGSFTFDASQLLPILEQSNIAMFGSCCPIAQIEFTNPMSFVMGSNFAVPAGAVSRMVADECEDPAVVFIETASLQFAIDTSKAVFDHLGFDSGRVKFITIPVTAQDYSAQVAQATDGTDCIYGGMSDSNWAAFLPAMQSLGGTQRLYGHQGNLNGVIAEQFPELTEGGVVVNSYPNIAGDMWADYRAALDEYDAPDLDWNSLAGLGTWTAYTAFVDIVSGMSGDINNETFLEAANAASEVDTGGMVPVLDLSTPWDGMGGAFPRIFNRWVTYDVISDGELEWDGTDAVDMTEALNSYTG